MKNSKAAIAVLSDNLEILLDSLEPDQLKKRLGDARSKSKKNTGNISKKLTHHQNDIVSILGFSDGFGAYKAIHKPNIDKFLQTHGLTKKSDLITPRHLQNPAWASAYDRKKHTYYGTDFCLSRQDISERLFHSDLPKPQRVFTGYNFNYWNHWEDGSQVFDLLTIRSEHQPIDPRFETYTGGINAINSNVELAYTEGCEEIATSHPDHPKRQIIDVVLGGYLLHFASYFHLLGDVLVDSAHETCGGRAYHAMDNENLGDEFTEAYLPIINLFRHRINAQPNGWVEVLPYNDNLVFIRGAKGQYDFVFRNQRDTKFDTKVYGENTPAKHVPTAMPDYEFEHWYHYQHNGWKANERCLAERMKLAGRLHQKTYETDREVLIQYYTSTGAFEFSVTAAATPIEGFTRVDVGTHELAISELVNIDDFMSWLQSSGQNTLPDGDDRLSTVNPESNYTLPAAATWRAAQGYIRDLERRTNTKLRLLKEPEYRALRKSEKISNTDLSCNRLLEFINPDGHKYDKRPEYISEEDFQSLFFKFRHEPDWLEHESGLHFINSDETAELLFEGTCIQSRSLTDFSCPTDVSPLRPVAKGSSGKYKSLRFVFRICHEIIKQ